MIIGITGKSGSGKTTITDLLNKENKYEIIHVDDITHLILELDEVKEILCSMYGQIIKGNDDNIDRKKLGNILFNDKEKMKEYNELIWLLIEKYIDNIISSIDKDVIIDWMQLPLTKYFTMSKFNILVEAPLEVRIERVKNRDEISEEYILNRERNSLDYDKEKFDYIVLNNHNDVDKQIEILKKSLERN